MLETRIREMLQASKQPAQVKALVDHVPLNLVYKYENVYVCGCSADIAISN